MRPIRRTLWRLTRLALCAYLTILLLLMIFEEALIFLPSKYPAGEWHPPGLAFEDAHFTTPDGTRLHGWYLDHPAPRAVILFAHGNAGNITHRAPILDVLHRQLQSSVLMFDYRGYGRSEGKPNEKGVLEDARAARAWLAHRAGVAESEVVLMGRSIGGAVMVDLAAGDGARALVLECSFTSVPDLAAVHYPWAPVHLLLRTRLDAASRIADYRGPLLQSHGDADEIAPHVLGRGLFEAATSANKKFLTISGGRHNDMWPPSYYDQLDEFLQNLPPAAPNQP